MISFIIVKNKYNYKLYNSNNYKKSGFPKGEFQIFRLQNDVLCILKTPVMFTHS